MSRKARANLTGRCRAAPVAHLPMAFVATTTSTAAYREITGTFWRIIQGSPPEIPPDPVRGWLNIGLTVLVVACVLVILVSAVLRWLGPAKPTDLVVPSDE